MNLCARPRLTRDASSGGLACLDGFVRRQDGRCYLVGFVGFGPKDGTAASRRWFVLTRRVGRFGGRCNSGAVGTTSARQLWHK